VRAGRDRGPDRRRDHRRASKFEAAEPLTQAGLLVQDFVIFLDREQGGADRLREKGYALHSALRISAVLAHLHEAGRLSPERFAAVWTSSRRFAF